MNGLKIEKLNGEPQTPQDRAYAQMLGLLVILGSGAAHYQRLVAEADKEMAQKHAAQVLDRCLLLFPEMTKLRQATTYMAEDLGFGIEALAVPGALPGSVQ